MSDGYGAGWYAAHFAYVQRHHVRLSCGTVHVGTMERSYVDSIYYAFTRLSWVEKIPQNSSSASTPVNIGNDTLAVVVQLVLTEIDSSISQIYAIDSFSGDVVLNVTSEAYNVTMPIRVIGGQILIVLPVAQWHMYSWIVALDDYTLPPTMMSIPILSATQQLNVPDNFVNPKIGNGSSSVVAWVLYSDCTTPDPSSANGAYAVLESANRGDSDPCRFSTSSCIVQR